MATAKKFDSDFFFIGKRYDGANDSERYTAVIEKTCADIRLELNASPAQELVIEHIPSYAKVLKKHCLANNAQIQKIDKVLRGAKSSNFKNN